MDKIVLGVDIGGTFTKMSLVDETGHILRQTVFPTHSENGASAYTKRLIRSGKELLSVIEGAPYGIGIGAPGCDPETGYISFAVNLPFTAPFPIKDFFEENLCAHTVLVKDSTAAALGEKMWGGAQDMQHFALLTLGTGLGSAFYMNGKMVEGAHHLASELGHTIHIPDGRGCTCGQRGCLETYVSARGLQREFNKLLAEEVTPSPLRDIPDSKRTSKSITQAAQQGDSLAIQALENCGDHLGLAISRIIHTWDPEGIFLSGGLSQAGDLLMLPLKSRLEKSLLPAFRGKTRIEFSKLGSTDTGTLGAAAQLFLVHNNGNHK